MKKIIAILLAVALSSTSFVFTSVAAVNWSVDVTTFAGSTFGNLDGPALSAQFGNPVDLAIDASGNIFVTDETNHTIRKIDTTGQVTTYAGTGGYGNTDGNISSASFAFPDGIVIDSTGNLFVVDRLNGFQGVRKITPSGVVSTLLSANTFSDPYGLAIDSNDNLYVTDWGTHSIYKVTPSGNVSLLAGSGVPGFADGQGAQASFSTPMGLTVDPAGNVYVADTGNHCIRKIDQNGVVTTIAGSTAGDVDGQGTQAQLNGPNGITIDQQGNLFVTDMSNKVKVIDTTGYVTTIAGTGTYGTTDGSGNVAEFARPWGIKADSNGDVYVIDLYSKRIRKLTITRPPSNVNRYVRPTKITLDKEQLILANGRSGFLLAEVSPVDVSFPEVGWSSSNEKVAVVDKKGIVTATGFGEATITAKVIDGGLSATATVLVEGPPKPGVKGIGYITGYPDGTFRPDRGVSQGELALMLDRLQAGKGLLVGDVKPEAIVTKGEWNAIVRRYLGEQNAYSYVFSASESQYVLTREEIVLVLNRLFHVPLVHKVEKSTFKDVPATHRSLIHIESAIRYQ